MREAARFINTFGKNFNPVWGYWAYDHGPFPPIDPDEMVREETHDVFAAMTIEHELEDTFIGLARDGLESAFVKAGSGIYPGGFINAGDSGDWVFSVPAPEQYALMGDVIRVMLGQENV